MTKMQLATMLYGYLKFGNLQVINISVESYSEKILYGLSYSEDSVTYAKIIFVDFISLFKKFQIDTELMFGQIHSKQMVKKHFYVQFS